MSGARPMSTEQATKINVAMTGAKPARSTNSAMTRDGRAVAPGGGKTIAITDID